jgi:hypothetical protein
MTGGMHELKYKVYAKDKASALLNARRKFKKDGHIKYDIFTEIVILGY